MPKPTKKKIPKVFKDKAYGVFSCWGFHQAFLYKKDAEQFVKDNNDPENEIYYYVQPGIFSYSFEGKSYLIPISKSNLRQNNI